MWWVHPCDFVSPSRGHSSHKGAPLLSVVTFIWGAYEKWQEHFNYHRRRGYQRFENSKESKSRVERGEHLLINKAVLVLFRDGFCSVWRKSSWSSEIDVKFKGGRNRTAEHQREAVGWLDRSTTLISGFSSQHIAFFSTFTYQALCGMISLLTFTFRLSLDFSPMSGTVHIHGRQSEQVIRVSYSPILGLTLTPSLSCLNIRERSF